MKSAIQFALAALFLICCVMDADAGGRRGRRGRRGQQEQQYGSYGGTVSASPSVTYTATDSCDDALSEVNAARAARGLRPYLNDPLLNEGARKCAAFRASTHCHGHCPGPLGDFAYLPSTVNTSGVAGGCAAWASDFGACAMYDNYTYCGAAWVRGSDGLKYCHLFVR